MNKLSNMLKHGGNSSPDLISLYSGVYVCVFVCQYIGCVSFVFAACNLSHLVRFVL